MTRQMPYEPLPASVLLDVIIDKNLLFHPFRNRPTGSPGIEGVRGEKGVGKVQSRESCPVSASWSINSDRNY